MHTNTSDSTGTNYFQLMVCLGILFVYVFGLFLNWKVRNFRSPKIFIKTSFKAFLGENNNRGLFREIELGLVTVTAYPLMNNS
jgi:hypothetical protein